MKRRSGDQTSGRLSRLLAVAALSALVSAPAQEAVPVGSGSMTVYPPEGLRGGDVVAALVADFELPADTKQTAVKVGGGQAEVLRVAADGHSLLARLPQNPSADDPECVLSAGGRELRASVQIALQMRAQLEADKCTVAVSNSACPQPFVFWSFVPALSLPLISGPAAEGGSGNPFLAQQTAGGSPNTYAQSVGAAVADKLKAATSKPDILLDVFPAQDWTAPAPQDTAAAKPGQPSISRIWPPRRRVGETVVVQGQGFGKDTKLIQVLFPRSAGQTPLWSDDARLLTRIPLTSGDGPVRVQVGNKTSKSYPYDVGESVSITPARERIPEQGATLLDVRVHGASSSRLVVLTIEPGSAPATLDGGQLTAVTAHSRGGAAPASGRAKLVGLQRGVVNIRGLVLGPADDKPLQAALKQLLKPAPPPSPPAGAAPPAPAGKAPAKRKPSKP